jgi:hypothetical protein
VVHRKVPEHREPVRVRRFHPDSGRHLT